MKLKNRFTGKLLPVKLIKIYKYIFISLYLCTAGAAYSAAAYRPFDTIKALSIGDRVPDITINNLINYPKTSAKLADFKGKLLILDFWGSWCSSCLKSFPKMDSLQKIFSGKLQILLVDPQMTKDTRERVDFTLKRMKYDTGKSTNLPIVLQDSLLSGYFKFVAIPHEVWIMNDLVIAITEAKYVNAANIAKVLREGRIDLPVKVDKSF